MQFHFLTKEIGFFNLKYKFMSEMMNNDKIDQFEDVKLGRRCIGYLYIGYF